MSDEKLYRMVLDVQNTAILQIKSCAKYSFSRDDVEKLEEDIRYRKSKFAGYIKDLQKNNDKKSKKLAVQDLHALFVEIEERLQNGESYDINHISDFENDLNKVIGQFTATKQSKIGPNKADALIDLLLTKVPEVWQ